MPISRQNYPRNSVEAKVECPTLQRQNRNCNRLPHRNSDSGSDWNWRHIGWWSFLERQLVPQHISRRALSAGFAGEQDDARGAEHRNKMDTTTVPSNRTMRYDIFAGLCCAFRRFDGVAARPGPASRSRRILACFAP
jgi:hypothetical protein